MTKTVAVGLGGRAYEVLIGPGLIESAGARIAPLLKRPRLAVVSDETVWGLHGARFAAALSAAGVSVHPVVLPPD
jgi:3-dehydroquinate synthase